MFEHPVDVRWNDVDNLGHVNHAVFLTYLEEARDAFYVQTFGGDPIYVVARVEIDLSAEVRYQDRRVTVRVEVERLGTTSLTTVETIVKAAGLKIAADARVDPKEVQHQIDWYRSQGLLKDEISANQIIDKRYALELPYR